MTGLTELAKRVEAATGPDRRLDADIADAVGWWQAERARLGWLAPKVLQAPEYTASLDAAMTPASGMTQAQVLRILHEALERCAKAEADTRVDLPRYVTAAALRARAAMGEG